MVDHQGSHLSDKNATSQVPPSADAIADADRMPRRIIEAGDGIGLSDYMDRHYDSIEKELVEYGAVLFRGFEAIGAKGLEQLVLGTYGRLLEYLERATKRHQVQGLVYTSTDTSPRYNIPLHNENSFASRWPGRIFFYCVQPPGEGGRTPIADIGQVYDQIDPQVRKRFEEHGVMYMRHFDTGPGLSWQEVFGTASKSQFEQQCKQDGIHFQWLESGRLRTRQVRPAVALHPKSQRQVWFNHAVTLHYTSLDPILAQTMLRQFGEENLPHNTYYGDGTPIEADVLEHIRQAYAAATYLFDWRAGDLLLLDNMQMAHGREAYRGEREIIVAMAEPLTWSKVEGGCGEAQYISAPQVAAGDDVTRTDQQKDAGQSQAPGNDAERLLADAVIDVLDLSSIGIHDNFFDLGIDSIAITRIIARVNADCGVELPIRAFFDTPTVAQLGKLLPPE